MNDQPRWHKSSYSNGNNSSCVEVAEGAPVRVRDTDHRHLGHLTFTPAAWTVFLRQVAAERTR
ncbi:uncharacterized protein DUF397 [Murinocardiopsis flavida]|uniref:Uncharacterized protein DUF397 n=1 Tax=Murinocardiopsis flavida TaxID=645275 RepID=A0A2P8DP35_9ACTN|nr:DUF397 domain-containing protein [Murinocardiopsis flavida]PSK98975.1 uncharacterized protein DUF397 [Murinocardiopsis flavida]